MNFYHVPSPAGYFSAFSLCLDYCDWDALSAAGKVMVPLNCEVCFGWVGSNQGLVKVSWLWELVSVFWWVELDLLSVECNTVSISDFVGVYGFDMALGKLSFNVHCCVLVLLEN